MRIHIALALLLLCGCQRPAPARRVREPPDNYLLEITREWEVASPLGDPRARPMAAGDVELRFWGGYGLQGTRAIVLRREGGRWSGWRVEVRGCASFVRVPDEGPARPNARALLRAEARRHCGEPPPTGNGEYMVMDGDTLALHALPGAGLGAAWDASVAAGVLELPARIRRPWERVDGDSYVVETRRGDDYRASVIEHTDPPETEDDRRVQRIAAMLRERFGRLTIAPF